MIQRVRIKEISKDYVGQSVTVCGWVRTIRAQKHCTFVELADGSTIGGMQVVVLQLCVTVTTGASVCVTGVVVESRGSQQALEIQANQVELIGACSPSDYPLQKKRHSFEFLRTMTHLRPRTRTQGAIMRVRNTLSFATHEFFQKKGFLYIQTPIITTSDCEGGGAQFGVTTLPLNHPPRRVDGEVDYGKDFFHRPAYLTVSGQLHGEAMACAFSDIYTFGPTFRAENSHTSRHVAEFWMVEPEMAFADLQDDMECAEHYLKFLVQAALERSSQEMEFFDTFVEKGLVAKLDQIIRVPFEHLTYTAAIDILKEAPKLFEHRVEWGCDLQSEHERYLAEEYCKRPVILTDYPAQIKSFYMRLNPDERTVAAMDILVPNIGEVIGGSQREERYEVLQRKMVDLGLSLEEYDWYLQLRQYGTVPHAGFGAGFDRVVQWITGMENIRDVIPFPRYPGHAEG